MGIKAIFVAGFLTLSVLPVAQWAFGLVDILALDEKRSLAPMPDFAGTLLRGDGRLSDAINRWFDDQYGFRSLFVRLKNQIDYSLFRHSDKVFIGSDGWLYHRGYFDFRIIWERNGNASAERVQQRYLELAQYLARRDIRLVVISNPDKETIYPQYLPADVPHIPKEGRFQRMRAWLKGRSEFIYIDDADVLEQNCPDFGTFSLIDVHMTFSGGVCVAKELVARIAKVEGSDVSPWEHAFSYSTGKSSIGAEADALALLMPPVQTDYLPDRVFGVNDPAFSSDPAGIFEWVYHAPANERANRLPPILLYGDSFLDVYRLTGFHVYFTDAYPIRGGGFGPPNLALALENLPAVKYFVFEFLESNLDEIMYYPLPDKG